MNMEELYADVERPSPADRPYLAVNMVESMDGATTIEGRSGGLGSAEDRAVFRTLRTAADAVLVGAGTARDEGYGPARLSEEQMQKRTEAGRLPTPRIVLVTRSVKLDPTGALFTEADAASPTTVIAPEDADPERLDAIAAVGEIITAGRGGVDLPAAMRALQSKGIRFVLCEGGPSLNADLAEAGLVDEVDLTVAPYVVGGRTRRLFAEAKLADPLEMELAHCRQEGRHVFLRYVRFPQH